MASTGGLLRWRFKECVASHGRSQRVIIRGQSSDWGLLKAGVPQGSVLGPLLFLVYINDLVSVVNCDIKLFADDTTLFITVDNPVDSDKAINPDLQRINEWAKEWVVLFNQSKTKSMTVSNRNIQHKPLYFSDTQLEEVQSHKHLGLLLTNDLTWSEHINTIIADVSKVLGVLARLKYTMDRNSLETIYFSFIRPKL